VLEKDRVGEIKLIIDQFETARRAPLENLRTTDSDLKAVSRQQTSLKSSVKISKKKRDRVSEKVWKKNLGSTEKEMKNLEKVLAEKILRKKEGQDLKKRILRRGRQDKGGGFQAGKCKGVLRPKCPRTVQRPGRGIPRTPSCIRTGRIVPDRRRNRAASGRRETTPRCPSASAVSRFR
jgi:hypothetical protein